MPQFDVVVIGEANVDHITLSDRLPSDGEELYDADYINAIGGKAVNQARAAARQGARVALIACVGADSGGDRIIETLEADGIDCQFIQRAHDVGTGLALLHIDKKNIGSQSVAWSGANARLQLDAGQLEDIDAPVLILQLTAPESVVRTAIEHFGKRECAIYVDIAGRHHLERDLCGYVEVMRGDDDEIETMTGIDPSELEGARRAGQWMRERGVKAIAAPCGDDGEVLIQAFHHDEEIVLEPFEADPVDPTGTGDAFLASLAVHRLRGASWRDAGRRAMATAALVLERESDEPPPTREEVERLVARGEKRRS